MSLSTIQQTALKCLEKYMENDVDDYTNIISIVFEHYLPKTTFSKDILFFQRFFVPLKLYNSLQRFQNYKRFLLNIPPQSDYRKCNYGCNFIFELEWFFLEYKPYGQYFLQYKEALQNFKSAFNFIHYKQKELVYLYESIIIVRLIRKFVHKLRSI